MYSDERDALVASHRGSLFAGHTPYFVRTENVSLKYGMHGVESLVASTTGHSPLSDDASSDDNTEDPPPPPPRPIKLYLIPWQPMSKDKEFRVFVCNNRVTCVSQQHLYQPNRLLAALDESGSHHRIPLIGVDPEAAPPQQLLHGPEYSR